MLFNNQDRWGHKQHVHAPQDDIASYSCLDQNLWLWYSCQSLQPLAPMEVKIWHALLAQFLLYRPNTTLYLALEILEAKSSKFSCSSCIFNAYFNNQNKCELNLNCSKKIFFISLLPNCTLMIKVFCNIICHCTFQSPSTPPYLTFHTETSLFLVEWGDFETALQVCVPVLNVWKYIAIICF